MFGLFSRDGARKITTRKGTGISVGSFVSNDGERAVKITLGDRGAILTASGARLIAKQMVEWADFAEAHPTSAVRWEAIIKKEFVGEGEVP